PRFSHPVHLVLGLFLWALWFVLAYGGLSVVCAFAPPEPQLGAATWINALLLVLALASCSLLLLLALRCWRASRAAVGRQQQARFVSQVSAAAYFAAALATLAGGLPTLVLPPCV